MANATLEVQVVFALPERSWRVAVRLPTGATVADAIRIANLGARVGSDFDIAGVAIHGRPAQDTAVLRDGDRIELLRALHADPKQARRARAANPDRD